MKALEAMGHEQAPGASSLFLAGLCVAWRFAIAAVLLGLYCGPQIRRLTRLELEQGAGIGFFGGFGLVLQMDGIAYTQASTSAFLTQAYCVLIPLWVSLRSSRLPPVQVVGACALAILGAGILAGIREGRLALGRGEWETLAGSVMFAGQILWLERPRYAGNKMLRVTFIMFLCMSGSTWILAGVTAPNLQALLTTYATPQSLAFIAALTFLCTLVTFPLANFWQPKVTATQAGLLYSTEPIFASLFALFLPTLLSRWTGIDYENEVLSLNLLLGGSLILAANLWLLKYPPPRPAESGSVG
jgi:drug/metabolite transporter (DMT)-like permease